MADITDIGAQLSALNKASKQSVALYHKFALSMGISDSALGVLYALRGADAPCSQNELCGEWSIPKQTINTAVSVLKRKGLISLSPVAGTRNKKSISLTDAGREFADGTVGRLREAELAAFKALSCEERELFVLLNRKYNRRLSENMDILLASREDEQ